MVRKSDIMLHFNTRRISIIRGLVAPLLPPPLPPTRLITRRTINPLMVAYSWRGLAFSWPWCYLCTSVGVFGASLERDRRVCLCLRSPCQHRRGPSCLSPTSRPRQTPSTSERGRLRGRSEVGIFNLHLSMFYRAIVGDESPVGRCEGCEGRGKLDVHHSASGGCTPTPPCKGPLGGRACVAAYNLLVHTCVAQ